MGLALSRPDRRGTLLLLAETGHELGSAFVVHPVGRSGSRACLLADLPTSVGRHQRCHCQSSRRPGAGAPVATGCLSLEGRRRHLAHDPGNFGLYCCRKTQFSSPALRAHPYLPTRRIVLLEWAPEPVHRNLLGGLACPAEPARPPSRDVGPACLARWAVAQLHLAWPRRLRFVPCRPFGHRVGHRHTGCQPSAGRPRPGVLARNACLRRAVARAPGLLCNTLLSSALGRGSRR